MFKADKIGRNGEQFSMLALCTLHKLYTTPGLLPAGFNNFLFFCHAVRLNKFFENFINMLFLVDSKIQWSVIFQIYFGKFLWIPLDIINLVRITTELPLSYFWMMKSLFLERFCKAMNSFLERFWGTLL